VIAEVVVAIDVLVPEMRGAPSAHHLQAKIPQDGDGIEHGEQLGLGQRGATSIGLGVAVALQWRGELHQAVGRHPQHGDPTAHVLEPPVGTSPLQACAHQSRQLGTIEARVIRDQRSMSASSAALNDRPQ